MLKHVFEYNSSGDLVEGATIYQKPGVDAVILPMPSMKPFDPL